MSEKHIESLRVFYSYANADSLIRSEIDESLGTLKQQGYISTYHDTKIKPGSWWKNELNGSLEDAHIILLLISPSYISSDYCHNNEMLQALERHKIGVARTIPIIVRPTDYTGEPFMDIQVLPTKAKPITMWPNRGEALLDVAWGIRIIVEELRESLLSLSSPKKEYISSNLECQAAIWNMPYRRNPFFTGRTELLQQLRNRFIATEDAAFTQALALVGIGGIGKTQIAIEYAYRHLNHYRYILWIDAINYENIVSSMVKIAFLLNILNKDDQDNAIGAVRSWLETHNKWLLILDNVVNMEMLDNILPIEIPGHIMLTTRSQAGGSLAIMINVEVMNFSESIQFLLQRAKLLPSNNSSKQITQKTQDLTKELAKVLGNLPLALDQAGAYIEELGCSISEYLNLYKIYHKDLLIHANRFAYSYSESVATTWISSLHQVEQMNPIALDLLRLCALLGSESIPEEIITKGASECSDVLRPLADTYTFQKAVETLRIFSFIRRKPDKKLLFMHRLLLVVLKDTMSEETQHYWAVNAVKAINLVFPSPTPRTWPLCKRLFPQALVSINLIEEYKLLTEEAAQLLSQISVYFSKQALYSHAEPLALHALLIREQILGIEHLDTIASLDNLASLYSHQEKFELAEQLYQRALSIRERIPGSKQIRNTEAMIIPKVKVAEDQI